MDPEPKVPPEELKLYAEEGCEQCLSDMTQGRRATKPSRVRVVDRNKFLHHLVFWHMVIIPGRSIWSLGYVEESLPSESRVDEHMQLL